MKYEKLLFSVKQGSVEWSVHALRNMLERGISRDAVLQIIEHGEIIELYDDDTPYPSALFLGYWKERPLHSVIAYDDNNGVVFIITAYEPDEEHFEPDWRTRRNK